MTRAVYDPLLQSARALIEAVGADARAFAAPAFEDGLAFVAPEAARLPVLDRLPACAGTASPLTRRLVDAIVAGRDSLDWRRTYRAGDGLGDGFLERYGWFNIVAPDGPFRSEETRVAVGYWSEGLRYLAHAHEPEELYVILAGEAQFFAEGRAPRTVRAGDTVRHAPWQAHGMLMTPGPLLAMGVLRGAALSAKPKILPGDPLDMERAA